MNQVSLDLQPRREAMQSALDHADRVCAAWSAAAFAFLRKYASEHSEVFAEDVTKAAHEWGLDDPPTKRAWGGIYHRAMKAGVLSKTKNTRARENGNLAMVYKSNRGD